ncbi:MAG: hypothetical protein LBF88_09870 [Planctomycetaceae bacterium]|nr:hypothetical protein [Planctomycetaceae bacterium]
MNFLNYHCLLIGSTGCGSVPVKPKTTVVHFYDRMKPAMEKNFVKSAVF